MKWFSVYMVIGLLWTAFVHLHAHDAKVSASSDETVSALFDDADDVIAQEAANTSIMQHDIQVKPISRTVLFVRKIWDNMLIVYVWVHGKYAKAYTYILGE